jgi:hypothetical protein
MKTKRSLEKRRTLVETIRVKNGVFLANEKQGNLFKRNLLGSNHLLQQTKLNKTENKKQLTLQEKRIMHEAIKI